MIFEYPYFELSADEEESMYEALLLTRRALQSLPYPSDYQHLQSCLELLLAKVTRLNAIYKESALDAMLHALADKRQAGEFLTLREVAFWQAYSNRIRQISPAPSSASGATTPAPKPAKRERRKNGAIKKE